LNFDGRCFGRDPSGEIPGEVQVICEAAFLRRRDLRSVGFGRDSDLRRIDMFAFSGCSVRSFSIPASVETIDGRAFNDSEIDEIVVTERNRHLRVSGRFLLGRDGKWFIPLGEMRLPEFRANSKSFVDGAFREVTIYRAFCLRRIQSFNESERLHFPVVLH
jgi:predicted nucleotidyltransferase